MLSYIQKQHHKLTTTCKSKTTNLNQWLSFQFCTNTPYTLTTIHQHETYVKAATDYFASKKIKDAKSCSYLQQPTQIPAQCDMSHTLTAERNSDIWICGESQEAMWFSLGPRASQLRYLRYATSPSPPNHTKSVKKFKLYVSQTLNMTSHRANQSSKIMSYLHSTSSYHLHHCSLHAPQLVAPKTSFTIKPSPKIF